MTQVALGLLLVAASAGLLAKGAMVMRNPHAAGLARKPFAAEFLAIFLIALFATGAGILIDFATGLAGAAAIAWSIGLAVSVPVVFVAVWHLSGARARLASYGSGGLSAANDRHPPRRGPAQRRAA